MDSNSNKLPYNTARFVSAFMYGIAFFIGLYATSTFVEYLISGSVDATKYFAICLIQAYSLGFGVFIGWRANKIWHEE